MKTPEGTFYGLNLHNSSEDSLQYRVKTVVVDFRELDEFEMGQSVSVRPQGNMTFVMCLLLYPKAHQVKDFPSFQVWSTVQRNFVIIGRLYI